MKVSDYTINNYNLAQANKPAFRSRCSEIRSADDICRRVMREFPSVYSNSKLFRYDTLKKYSEGAKLKCYSEELLRESRMHYNAPSSIDYQYYREFANMKKYKVSNCGELADATQLALMLNGHEDVKILELYAYNKDTKTMRNLDHSVVGINFKLPKKYEYNYYHKQYNLSPDYRIYPQKDSIIVDSWLGKSDFAKNLTSDYNSHKGLIRGTKHCWEELSPDATLLKEGEEFCFVPIYQGLRMSDNAVSHFGKKYKGLILERNKGKVDLSKIMVPPVCETISEYRVQNIRKAYEMGEFAQRKTEPQKQKSKSKLKSFLTMLINLI